MSGIDRETEARKELKKNIAIAMRGDDRYRRWPLQNMISVAKLLDAAEAREAKLLERIKELEE